MCVVHVWIGSYVRYLLYRWWCDPRNVASQTNGLSRFVQNAQNSEFEISNRKIPNIIESIRHFPTIFFVLVCYSLSSVTSMLSFTDIPGCLANSAVCIAVPIVSRLWIRSRVRTTGRTRHSFAPNHPIAMLVGVNEQHAINSYIRDHIHHCRNCVATHSHSAPGTCRRRNSVRTPTCFRTGTSRTCSSHSVWWFS